MKVRPFGFICAVPVPFQWIYLTQEYENTVAIVIITDPDNLIKSGLASTKVNDVDVL